MADDVKTAPKTRCPRHVLVPLFIKPRDRDLRIDYLLSHHNDWRKCSQCGRVGSYTSFGNFHFWNSGTWVDAKIRESDEWNSRIRATGAAGVTRAI